jgi:hypothetical protein
MHLVWLLLMVHGSADNISHCSRGTQSVCLLTCLGDQSRGLFDLVSGAPLTQGSLHCVPSFVSRALPSQAVLPSCGFRPCAVYRPKSTRALWAERNTKATLIGCWSALTPCFMAQEAKPQAWLVLCASRVSTRQNCCSPLWVRVFILTPPGALGDISGMVRCRGFPLFLP